MLNIIFSKNRPLQLHLTLQSIEKNWGGKTIVICKYDDEYEDSYVQISEEFPNISLLIQKKDLIYHTKKAIIEYGGEEKHVAFFTDDDIVFSYAGSYLSEEVLNEALKDSACFSLRMGANISKRDFGNGRLQDDNIPALFPCSHNIMKWNRTSVPTGGYWSYPLSVDGHIFKIEVVEQLLYEINSWQKDIQTPNEFESLLQRFWFELPPIMSCPKFSCVVNSPNNRVQETVKNRSGDHFPIDPENALKKFMSGKRINIDRLQASVPNIVCPHQELNLLSFLE